MIHRNKINDLQTAAKSYGDSEQVKVHHLTEFREISNQIVGLRAGTLNLITGETGLGKSNLAISFALDLVQTGVKVLYVSTEMGNDDVMCRILAKLNKSNFYEYENIKAENKPRIHRAIQELKQLPLTILYEKNFEEIISKIDYQFELNPEAFDVIIIDHKDCLRVNDPKIDMIEAHKDVYVIKHLEKIWNQYKSCLIVVGQIPKSNVANKRVVGDKDDFRGSAHWAYLASNMFYLLKTKDQKEKNQTKNLGEPDLITLCLSKTRYQSKNFNKMHEFNYRSWAGDFKYINPIKND